MRISFLHLIPVESGSKEWLAHALSRKLDESVEVCRNRKSYCATTKKIRNCVVSRIRPSHERSPIDESFQKRRQKSGFRLNKNVASNSRFVSAPSGTGRPVACVNNLAQEVASSEAAGTLLGSVLDSPAPHTITRLSASIAARRAAKSLGSICN